MKPRTNVYIDGFNFYYGCVKGTEYKWLDLRKFTEAMLPGHNIQSIKYFTAKVKPTDDPKQPVRQAIYLRAIQTIRGVSVVYGDFQRKKRPMPVAESQAKKSLSDQLRKLACKLTIPFWGKELYRHSNGMLMARVWRVEEKGSDVNMAVAALLDGLNDEYDCAVLITGDSDLKQAAHAIRNDLKKSVGVINPRSGKAAELQEQSDFYKTVRTKVLASNQLPSELKDSIGVIRKPAEW